MSSPRYLIATLGMMVIGAGCRAPADKATPVDATADVEAHIDALLAQMTLEEKVGMIHASSSFTSGGVERLGIPELVMSDGPHGVRHEHTRYYDKATDVAASVKHYIANSLESSTSARTSTSRWTSARCARSTCPPSRLPSRRGAP
jgi:hypothetical protein